MTLTACVPLAIKLHHFSAVAPSYYCANISVVSIAQRWDLSVFCLVNSPIDAKVNPLNVKLVNSIFVPAWERKEIYRRIVQLSYTYLHMYVIQTSTSPNL